MSMVKVSVSVSGDFKIPVTRDGETEFVTGRGADPHTRDFIFRADDAVVFTIGPVEPDNGEALAEAEGDED